MASTNWQVTPCELNRKIYVAVNKDRKTCKSILNWTITYLKAKRICLVHVHQPAQYFSKIGTKPASSPSKNEVMVRMEKEREYMQESFEEYTRLCSEAQVQVQRLCIEKETIKAGLVELISQYKIERLVMGAAANKRYSRLMIEPTSKKANYVREHAPPFCHISFVCKGHLICIRKGMKQSKLYDALTRLNELSSFPSRGDSEASSDLSSSSKVASRPEGKTADSLYYKELERRINELEQELAKTKEELEKYKDATVPDSR